MPQRHRLQRLASPSRSASLLFHLLGVTSFGLSFRYLADWETPITHSYGGHYQFFTIIGLSTSLVSFSLAVLADITGIHTIFAAKNALSVLAAPLELLISILYWGLVVIDKELVVPKEFTLPLMPDLGFHLAPAVLLSLDLILFSPPQTIRAYSFMALSTIVAFGYWYWVEVCFSQNGWYPYPLFELLSTEQRVGLFVFSALLVTASSGMLKWTYGLVNGYESALAEPHKPLKKIQ